MTLEGTPSSWPPEGIEGLLGSTTKSSPPTPAAEELQQHNVEAIVVLLHEGGAETGTFNQCVGISGPIVAVSPRTSTWLIHMVVTGHTHLPYVCNIPDPAGNPRMVTSLLLFGRVVTETWLTIDKYTP